MDVSSAKSPGPATALPGARTALLLLLAINLFNYIDRQVLAAVEPEIRNELFPEKSDFPAGGLVEEREKFVKSRMGLLATAFIVSYMFLAPLFGWLAERTSRWLLVGIGVILWSLASGASGLPWGANLAFAYWALLVTRCFVGVGEGAYGPVAPAMLSDLYPVEQRGRILAWFYLAIPVGGALGYAFGEIVQGMAGWRWAFYLVVPPGLLLGIWCFFLKDPPRGQRELVAVEVKKVGFFESLRVLLIPSYLLNTLGMTAMTFAIGGLAWWMPAFLEERAVPPTSLFGLVTLGPRTLFGVITALAGLIATLAGGLIGDWLRPKISGSYFFVSGLAMLGGFPMVLGMLEAPFPFAWLFVFVAVFCLFFNTGPTNTVLANVTHPSVRASAFAINIFIIHALGDAISPFVIGYIADQNFSISGYCGLDAGFVVVSLFMMLGGVLWLWGTWFLKRDTELAPTRI